MKRTLLFLAVVSLVAFCFGTMALAEGPRITPKVIHNPTTKANVIHSNTLADGLYGGWATLAGTPEDYYASPTNSDGYPIWPCFGGGTAANADCPQIGDPAQPNYGIEVGSPFYTWPLALCTGGSSAAAPCGESETWYEDDSNDTTDILAYEIYAKQGTDYVLNSGWQLYGPNPFGGEPGANVLFSGPLFIGTGECSNNNYNYPIPAAQKGTPACTSSATCVPNPTYPIEIAPTGAGATCHNTVAGTVNFETVTELAEGTASKFVFKNSATTCAGVSSAPYCYTFTVTSKGTAYAVTQKWNNALE